MIAFGVVAAAAVVAASVFISIRFIYARALRIVSSSSFHTQFSFLFLFLFYYYSRDRLLFRIFLIRSRIRNGSIRRVAEHTAATARINARETYSFRCCCCRWCCYSLHVVACERRDSSTPTNGKMALQQHQQWQPLKCLAFRSVFFFALIGDLLRHSPREWNQNQANVARMWSRLVPYYTLNTWHSAPSVCVCEREALFFRLLPHNRQLSFFLLHFSLKSTKWKRNMKRQIGMLHLHVFVWFCAATHTLTAKRHYSKCAASLCAQPLPSASMRASHISLSAPLFPTLFDPGRSLVRSLSRFAYFII